MEEGGQDGLGRSCKICIVRFVTNPITRSVTAKTRFFQVTMYYFPASRLQLRRKVKYGNHAADSKLRGGSYHILHILCTTSSTPAAANAKPSISSSPREASCCILHPLCRLSSYDRSNCVALLRWASWSAPRSSSSIHREGTLSLTNRPSCWLLHPWDPSQNSLCHPVSLLDHPQLALSPLPRRSGRLQRHHDGPDTCLRAFVTRSPRDRLLWWFACFSLSSSGSYLSRIHGGVESFTSPCSPQSQTRTKFYVPYQRLLRPGDVHLILCTG